MRQFIFSHIAQDGILEFVRKRQTPNRKKWGFAALFSHLVLLGVTAALFAISADRVKVFAAEKECLAVTLFREGQRGNIVDQVAIAQNVLNRTVSPRYPSTVCKVVNEVRTNARGQRVAQYSYVLERHLHPSQERSARHHWATTQLIAHAILSDWMKNGRNFTVYADIRHEVRDSENYHTPGVRPYWEVSGLRSCELKSIGLQGAHIHYAYYSDSDPRGHRGCRISLARANRPVSSAAMQMTRPNPRPAAPVRRAASR